MQSFSTSILEGGYFGNLDAMNYVKGFRFHPTDEEAMELLWDKIEHDSDSIVQVGDSSVRVITQLKDICEFEPWELPGRSELGSGDNVWYFFSSPRYKYRNSKRKNRVTKRGYWKPTGKPHETVITYDGKEIIGSRHTLVFYQGRVSDKKKNENRTPWVMHELTLSLPNQKSLALCKLKKKYGKVDVSRGDEGQSSHPLPSSLENHCTNNAIPKDQLNSNGVLTESEAFTEYSGIQSQSTTNEQDDDEFVGSLLIDNDEIYSKHPYFVDENEGNKLSSTYNLQIHVADNDIPKHQEGFCELINQKPKAPNECVGTLDEVRTSEYDNSSWSSILTANDQTYSKEGSRLFAEIEGSSLALENHMKVDSIPMECPEFDELLRKGIFVAELVEPLPEAPKNSDGDQNHQFSTNEQDDEFWNSILFPTDEVEAYPEVLRSKQQNLADKNDGFNFSMSIVESPNDPFRMGSTRKRPRIESEGLTSKEDIEATPALEKKYCFNTEQAQADSYNKGALEYDGNVTYN
ncbi:NAC domain-containing protein 91-like [Durio zibethinus]|uniref:NAC domain-containing protein 91-like n=1 Tax=Durio zibethinus TaxID=66656 RepID=A0A6P6B0N3_DURZI|nr:NAC domain-containing protein 91-like [Durio zibethinus]